MFVDEAEHVTEFVQHDASDLVVRRRRREPAVVHRWLRFVGHLATRRPDRGPGPGVLERYPDEGLLRIVEEAERHVGHAGGHPFLAGGPYSLLHWGLPIEKPDRNGVSALPLGTLHQCRPILALRSLRRPEPREAPLVVVAHSPPPWLQVSMGRRARPSWHRVHAHEVESQERRASPARVSLAGSGTPRQSDIKKMRGRTSSSGVDSQ